MKKNDKQGWMIIGGVVAVFALLGSLAVYANVAQKKYDPDTLCPLEGQGPAVRILIDKTDPWDAGGSARLEKIIRCIKDDLAVSERLSIAVLDESGSEVPTPVFDMCNPGRGDQANPLYKNQRRIHEKFEARFDRPLEQMLVDILKPGTAPRSPLLEAVENFPVAGENDRLVIISDLMQNSQLCSFYLDGESCAEEKRGQSDRQEMKRYRSITVYYVDRGALARNRKEMVCAFWKEYLGQRAVSFDFQRL